MFVFEDLLTCNLHPQFQIPNASHLYLSTILFILIKLVSTRHCTLALNNHNFFISMTSRRISQLWKVTHNLFFLSIQEDQIIWNVEMCGQTAEIYDCVQTISWNVSTGVFLIIFWGEQKLMLYPQAGNFKTQLTLGCIWTYVEQWQSTQIILLGPAEAQGLVLNVCYELRRPSLYYFSIFVLACICGLFIPHPLTLSA